MAQSILKTNEGSPLIGSPITYKVVAETISGVCAFHRVNLSVFVKLSTSAAYKEIKLSSPADSGKSVYFNVSSSLLTAADGYTYEVNPPASYPYVEYYLQAWDEWMKNGEQHESQKITLHAVNNPEKAVMGAFSDIERFISGGSKAARHFTRKPKSLPEIVMVGETMVCPQSFNVAVSLGSITTGPTSSVVNITTEGLQTINDRFVYALPAGQKDRYQFRFVNGLGCMESISLSTLRATDTNYTVENYIRSIQETFGSFSRGIVNKKNDYETWKMSTPPLDEVWQSWFMHEFVMAKFVWINIDGYWIPCHIVPEETTSGLNRTEASLLTVSFSVQLDINGSPLTALAI